MYPESIHSGRGTRKRAAAHAVLLRGTGLFRVNGQQELCEKPLSREKDLSG